MYYILKISFSWTKNTPRDYHDHDHETVQYILSSFRVTRFDERAQVQAAAAKRSFCRWIGFHIPIANLSPKLPLHSNLVLYVQTELNKQKTRIGRWNGLISHNLAETKTARQAAAAIQEICFRPNWCYLICSTQHI